MAQLLSSTGSYMKITNSVISTFIQFKQLLCDWEVIKVNVAVFQLGDSGNLAQFLGNHCEYKGTNKRNVKDVHKLDNIDSVN